MSGQRVGVVGDGELASAVEAAGGQPVVDSDASDIDLLVAEGETALVDVARRGIDVPVLPVGSDVGVRAVSREDVETVLERVLDGEYDTVRHPVVGAAVARDASIESDSTAGSPEADTAALFDVALMAAEPARISEFAVHCRGDPVARFRADGVVASTPAGSVGYNRAAEGPVIAPETDVVAVVPIAPFATHVDRWVLPVEDVTLSVERDETPVELLVDGRTGGSFAAGDAVSLSTDRDVRTVVVPESGPFF